MYMLLFLKGLPCFFFLSLSIAIRSPCPSRGHHGLAVFFYPSKLEKPKLMETTSTPLPHHQSPRNQKSRKDVAMEFSARSCEQPMCPPGVS